MPCIMIKWLTEPPVHLGAVWFRGYPQVVRGSHSKNGCQTFGLEARVVKDNQISGIFL
jgi:hypothetical protein